jgi:hypothetical protein
MPYIEVSAKAGVNCDLPFFEIVREIRSPSSLKFDIDRLSKRLKRLSFLRRFERQRLSLEIEQKMRTLSQRESRLELSQLNSELAALPRQFPQEPPVVVRTETLQHDWATQFNNAEHSDVELHFNDGAPIFAHMLVLQVRCPALAAALKQQQQRQQQQSQRLVVNFNALYPNKRQCSRLTVFGILRFLYTGSLAAVNIIRLLLFPSNAANVDELSLHRWDEFQQFAQHFQLKKLADDSELLHQLESKLVNNRHHLWSATVDQLLVFEQQMLQHLIIDWTRFFDNSVIGDTKPLEETHVAITPGADSVPFDVSLAPRNKSFSLSTHKLVLRARCGFYRALFEHPWRERSLSGGNSSDGLSSSSSPMESYAVLGEIDPETAQQFLRYLYTDCVSSVNNDAQLACDLLVLATAMCLPRLKSICERALAIEHLPHAPELALDLYHVSALYDASQLVNRCLHTLAQPSTHEHFCRELRKRALSDEAHNQQVAILHGSICSLLRREHEIRTRLAQINSGGKVNTVEMSDDTKVALGHRRRTLKLSVRNFFGSLRARAHSLSS